MTLTECKTPLTSLMHELAFPADGIEALTADFDRICACPDAAALFSDCLARYDSSLTPEYDKIYDDAGAAGALCEVHEYAAKLLILCLMALRLRQYYRDQGMDDEIFLASASDLTWKLLECRAVKGINGTFVAGWFSGFYRLERFALGRLQFELTRFGRTYEKAGKALAPDATVVNIHIPRSLQPLSPALVKDALDRAYAFYRPRLPEGQPFAFVCSSWLLYAAHREFLPAHSNLLTFMDRFDLIENKDNAPGAHPDLWRLFDCDYTGDPDALPADSSLRRAYIGRLKEGKPTGHAYGVCFWG